MKGQLVIQLNYHLQDGAGANGNQVEIVFTHPDLSGVMTLVASSERLAKVQLANLDVNKEDHRDPFQKVLDSANKLSEGISQLKQTFNKK